MARAGKDTEEVATFRRLYAQLREWIDDEPDQVVVTAARDEDVDKLCQQLDWAADALRRAEGTRPELFSGPTDPAFIKDWRDYGARYDTVVSYVASRWLAGLLDLPEAGPQPAPGPARQWAEADEMATDAANGLECALEFADEQISQDWRWTEGFAESIEEGLAEWKRLKEAAGFDLRGVIRRRRLVPFILVPRHVSARYGDGDRASLLVSLRAAHDAFVFGAPLAALAMMRAILEATLRDHYPPRGGDMKLDVRINQAQALPKAAPRAALHRIRMMGNVVMHSGDNADWVLPAADATETEQAIVSLLIVLRSLIEEAPQGPPRLGG